MGKCRSNRWLPLLITAFALALTSCSCSSGGGSNTGGSGGAGGGGGAGGRTATILCLGDSQTYSTGYGLTLNEYWPAQAQLLAKADGYSVSALNEGHSNWTTADLLGIAADRLQKSAPNIVILYAGVNDKEHSLTSATTQSNIQAIIDTALSKGASYILIVNTNYLNYSSRGDNALKGTYYSNNQTLRTFQLAAANYGIIKYGASKVGYCDLFAYQKSLILAGTWTQGRWQDSQVADLNLHMNPAAQKATSVLVWNTLKGVAGLLAPYKRP